MTPALRFLVVGFAIGVAGLAGCSGTRSEGTISPHEGALQEVADLLRAATGANGRGPTKLANLSRLEAQYPRGYQVVKSGEVVVLWGAKMPREGEAGTDAVIAYEKRVPSEGGYVLLQNGIVKAMTADEFNATPKAK